MAKEIVKVQVPLSGGGRHNCLVYDKRRQHSVEQSVPSEVMTRLRGDYKGYFEAEWTEDKWEIGDRVAAQSW